MLEREEHSLILRVLAAEHGGVVTAADRDMAGVIGGTRERGEGCKPHPAPALAEPAPALSTVNVATKTILSRRSTSVLLVFRTRSVAKRCRNSLEPAACADPASTRSSHRACEAQATALSTLSLKARPPPVAARTAPAATRNETAPRSGFASRTSGRIVELETQRVYVHAGILQHVAVAWVFKERVRLL